MVAHLPLIGGVLGFYGGVPEFRSSVVAVDPLLFDLEELFERKQLALSRIRLGVAVTTIGYWGC